MQRLRFIRRATVGAFVFYSTIGSMPVSAQTPTGTVSGRVTLENGEPVHGAMVIIVGARRQTTTGDDGKFEITNLPPGTYDVLAQRAQLATSRQTTSVTAGQTASLEFKLAVGIHEEITVTGTAIGAATTYEAFNAVTSLDSTEIGKKLGATIADALQDEPGIAKRTFGPGTSRPIIRGFDGDRVLIMQDGVRTGDLSSQSGAALVALMIGSGAAYAQAQSPPRAASPPAPPAATPASASSSPRHSEIERIRAELAQLRKDYEQRLDALEQRLEKSLEARKPGSLGAWKPESLEVAKPNQVPPPTQPPPTPPPPVQPPPDQPAPAQQPTLSSKVFNPDISVNGNFVGAAGKNEASDQPPLQLTEVEAAFQAIVDPYAKADFFLSAGPEGLEVEEGYITFTSLPKSLLLKVGKMRAQFGKVNTLHTHHLPSVDRPLVTANLVGGDEGLSDAGMSLSYLLHNPALFVEGTGEVYRGDSDVFQSLERSELAYVGRIRAYRDITEGTNIDVGASLAFGPADVGATTPEGAPVSLDKRMFGFDATFRYRPLRRAIYQRLNLRTELIWSRQDLPDDLHANAFGFYALGEYQFARRWYVGARGDRSGRALDSSLVDTGGSVFLTFWPTEFSQIRGQYRRTSYAEGISGNEFLFQFNFSIGAHGAHIF
jgi:hypothetical protein